MSGNATPLVNLYVYDGANLIGATSADSSGVWQIFLPAASGTGTKYEITFKAGGESYVKTVTIVANGETLF